MQQSSLSQNASYGLRILNCESNASRTIAQRSEEYLIASWPLAVERKPSPKVTSAPNPPTPTKKRRLTDLNVLDVSQRNALVTAERKIVAMKNDLLVCNFDEFVFVDCVHAAKVA